MIHTVTYVFPSFPGRSLLELGANGDELQPEVEETDCATLMRPSCLYYCRLENGSEARENGEFFLGFRFTQLCLMLNSLDLCKQILGPLAAAEMYERGAVNASATRPRFLLLV